MSDCLTNLYAAIAARPANGIVGQRGAQYIHNPEFLARIRAWHAVLHKQTGRNFALYIEDSIEFAAALLGAWYAGKTVWLSADTLPASCAALSDVVDGFLGEYPAEIFPLQPPADVIDVVDVINAEDDVEFPPLDVDIPVLVVFTSGSTGTAQAIPKKLSQIASEVDTLEQLFGTRVGDATVLATVSHQHIYGLLFKVLWPLSNARVIYATSFTYPEELMSAMSAGPCVLVASPAHLKRLPPYLNWSDAAASLRSVFSSGAPLAADAALAVGAMLGHVPIEVYGSSESGGVAWRQRSSIDDDTWQPFPTVAWRIGTEDSTLEVRSPHLADDHWLALSDRAAPSESGFRLLGRNDRIVKIEEKRVSLDAMEAALLASGLAVEARVVLCEAMQGERQRLAAFVVPSTDGRALLNAQGKLALNARLRTVLAAVVDAVALPRRWRYLDHMPVNAQGKVTVATLLSLLNHENHERPHQPHVQELEHTSEQVRLTITAPPDLVYFEGHFDVAPILPGVVQVDWAIQFGRQYFNLPAHFKSMSRLKFQQVIVPNMPVQLELVHNISKQTLCFTYTSAAGTHSSGCILMGEA